MPGMLNNYKVISQEYGFTVIETMPCMICGKTSNIEVSSERFWRWHNGERIQNVFPDWSADQRELLVSGTHPECWDSMFKEND